MKILIVLLYSLFLSTTGHTESGWIKEASPTLVNLNAVRFVNANTGLVVGDNGIILRSTDSGQNWKIITSGFTNNLRSVFFTTTDTGYIAGDDGLILKSTNGGETWLRQSLNSSADFTSIFFPSTQLGYMGGYINSGFDSKIFKTTNSGASFDSIPIPGIDRIELLSSMFFINENTGWITGTNEISGQQIISKTTDGCITYTNQFFSHSQILHQFFL